MKCQLCYMMREYQMSIYSFCCEANIVAVSCIIVLQL